MAQGCFQILSTEDTILSINGLPVNQTVAEWVAANPANWWISEPTGYYPDLYTTWTGDAPEMVIIMSTGQTQLVAGSHPPRIK